MALPYLQSYNDPKIQKAYERCLSGQAFRKIASALKLPLRTLARRSKEDGWIEERKARAASVDSPTVATVATEACAPLPVVANETRDAGMNRILARQQRIVSRLVEAYENDVERTLAAAAEKPLTRSQIYQLTSLGNNLMAMERKAWCVPDKIETKDTTDPAIKHVDLIRQAMAEAEAGRAASEGKPN